MRKGARTKQQVVDAAVGLFTRQGYHATGVNQVLAESGAPRGSLYFHFPEGKQQLAAESVETAGERVCLEIEAILERHDEPGAAFDEIAELFCTALEASDFQNGCPVATVALEASSESPAVRQACENAYEAWSTALRLRFLGWGVEQDRAAELAVVALSMIEGALLLARVQRDPGVIRVVAKQLAEVVRAARSRS